MTPREKLGSDLCFDARTMAEERFDDPDDDWSPMLFVSDGEEIRLVLPLAVSGLLVDGPSKDVLFGRIVPLFVGAVKGAEAAGMVLSSWMVKTDPEDLDSVRDVMADAAANALHVRPDRTEVLTVTAADADGVTNWVTEIKRDGLNPPTLGGWSMSDEIEGRVGDGLRSALRR